MHYRLAQRNKIRFQHEVFIALFKRREEGQHCIMSLTAPYSLVSGSDQSTVERSDNHLQTGTVTEAAAGLRKANESDSTEMDNAGQISAANATSENLYIPPKTTATKKDRSESESCNAASNHTRDSNSRNSAADRSSLPSLNLRSDSTGASNKLQKGILKKSSVSHSESDGASTVQRSSKAASFSLDIESTGAEAQDQSAHCDSSGMDSKIIPLQWLS